MLEYIRLIDGHAYARCRGEASELQFYCCINCDFRNQDAPPSTFPRWIPTRDILGAALFFPSPSPLPPPPTLKKRRRRRHPCPSPGRSVDLVDAPQGFGLVPTPRIRAAHPPAYPRTFSWIWRGVIDPAGDAARVRQPGHATCLWIRRAELKSLLLSSRNWRIFYKAIYWGWKRLAEALLCPAMRHLHLARQIG